MINERIYKPIIPIYFREHNNSHTLIIAFTSHGGAGKLFELYKVLYQYNKTHQLFLSPKKDLYFFTNLDDEFNIENVFDLIKELIKKYNIEKVITLGNSAGATGAIYYGVKLAEFIKTSIIACAPSNPFNWNFLNDITRPIINEDNFIIYIDKEHYRDVDVILPIINQFKIQDVPNAKHNVMKTLYLTGELFTILDNELDYRDVTDVQYGSIEDSMWYYSSL